MEMIGIPGAAVVMSLLVITAVLSCLNTGLYITSRMLFELAQRGDAPRFLGMVAANKTPTAGIIIGCVSGTAAALAQIFMKGDVFTLLANTSGDIILFVYAIIALAEIRQRQRYEAEGVVLTLKMWLFPWLSWAVAGGIGVVVVLLALLPDQRPTLFLSLLPVAVVVGAWLLRRQTNRA
jgi:GABA permease